ncbi:ETX/MTX2 family pore-forming toxin [Ornithinimicrobium avium]|uniref:Uncharacterized protein n=1 Tax=Ornithinimicrobium avium TaxID=2283195 RepID=A0A345NKR8_9MICO|nr:ETX/MTX2 family pore-forming toxin [Ornithinimicrobium avium]AXH95626.1 hypothetical protein DV701_05390 [Ornithinimicrobium avium]
MSDIDVNQRLRSALESQYEKFTDKGQTYWTVVNHTCRGFDTSKVLLRLLAIDYPGLSENVISQPVVLSDNIIRNPSSATVTTNVEYNKSVTDTFGWNVSAGLKLAASAKFQAGVPIIGQAEATTSVEISLSGGVQSSHSEQTTYKSSVQVKVDPHSSVRVKAILTQGKVDALPFRATLQAYGLVGAERAYGGGTAGPSNWNWDWADLDSGGWKDPNFKQHPPVLKDGSARKFVLDGLFSATCGLSTHVVTEDLAEEELANVTSSQVLLAEPGTLVLD